MYLRGDQQRSTRAWGDTKEDQEDGAVYGRGYANNPSTFKVTPLICRTVYTGGIFRNASYLTKPRFVPGFNYKVDIDMGRSVPEPPGRASGGRGGIVANLGKKRGY